MTEPANIVSTVKALFSDATLLLKQEAALARAETEEKLAEAGVGIAAIAAGAIIGLVALLVLTTALVAALAELIDGFADGYGAALAALIVGVIYAIIAFIAIKSGQEKLSARNLRPDRTIHSLRESTETIMEATEDRHARPVDATGRPTAPVRTAPAAAPATTPGGATTTPRRGV